MDSHIVVAAVGESLPLRNASMSRTCICQVETEVRAASSALRLVSTCRRQELRMGPAVGRKSATGHVAPSGRGVLSAAWKSAIASLALARVWLQKLLACWRVMA